MLSAQPALPSPPSLNDKQAHALTYGVLAFLCLMGLTGWRWRRIAGASLLAALVIAVLYGVSDEVHQAFVPGRTPDVADVRGRRDRGRDRPAGRMGVGYTSPQTLVIPASLNAPDLPTASRAARRAPLRPLPAAGRSDSRLPTPDSRP